MSASIEFNLKADEGEWLDVTTKEELLETDVIRLKEALKACTAELQASNKLVQELSNQNNTLVKAEVFLQKVLQDSKDALNQVESKLKVTEADKDAVEIERDTLQKALKDSKDDRVHLEGKLEMMTAEKELIEKKFENFKAASVAKQESLDKEALRTTNNFKKVVNDLKTKLSSVETISKAQKEDIHKMRSQLDAVHKELAAEKKSASLSSMQLEMANNRLGSVAVLAEDRKDERLSLQRSVAQLKLALSHSQIDLEHSHTQVSSLKQELSGLKSASEQRIKELESSLSVSQKDLKEARTEVKMQEDSLQARLKEIEKAQVQIDDLKAELKNQTSELEESRSQEEATKKELDVQKIAYEHRLDNIREVLGVKKNNNKGKENNDSPLLASLGSFFNQY